MLFKYIVFLAGGKEIVTHIVALFNINGTVCFCVYFFYIRVRASLKVDKLRLGRERTSTT